MTVRILIVLCHHLRLLNRLGVLQRPILTSQPPRDRTVHDAVGRVILTLLEVLDVRVVKELFDSLANTELNGLLTNHVDVERAYHDAFVQPAKRITSVWATLLPLPRWCVQNPNNLILGLLTNDAVQLA